MMETYISNLCSFDTNAICLSEETNLVTKNKTEEGEGATSILQTSH